ncbi:hypothetical protein FAM09_22155 [Niastella caeni]|uniref:Uncharacterized protein n=1 Tax=Niastella caeni TaxID=2569763 RepID=A0A4S8HMZ8_9BACT|nr:hypothetical protein [Niastella caeni]THU36091.1 hypothetical protein FAM09_22155 [Niastella caeni]
MKFYLSILLLLWLPAQLSAIAANGKSIGTLNFRANGQLYTADSTHARGYAVKQTSIAYINGASNNMVIGIEWKGVKGPGTFSIGIREGKVEFTLDHKTYFPQQAGDYLKVTVKTVKQLGAFLLLNGTFEGQLQDRNGNKLKITEGNFETLSL